ncbi:GspE/PulE/PilB domain-containing protein [Thermosulfuriphilus sp.]
MKAEIPEEIKKRLIEAEVYLDQGLIDEARSVYETLLKELPELAPEDGDGLREEIQKKLATLGQESSDSHEAPVLLEVDENEKAFLNAIALKDSGFLPEAINEFRRLIEKGYREFECWRHLGEAYISHGMIYEGIEALKKALEAPGVGTDQYLDTCYRIGLALETAGAYTKAIQYYEKVKEINPSYLNVAERIEELSRQVERFGRFYYLIQKKIITEEDFEEATKLAKERGTSIEKTLIEDFGVPKEEVGKALAEFYKRPFVEFNELEAGEKPSCLEGVREQFLRANVCVPILEKPGGTVVVAIDNPNDIVKIDAIRRVIKAKNLEFVVALREDINQFIDYFYGKYGLTEEDEDVFSQLEVIPEEEEE